LEWTDASILADMASNGLISLDAFSTKIYAKVPMFQHGRFLPVKYYSNQYIGLPSELFRTPSAIIFCVGGGGIIQFDVITKLYYYQEFYASINNFCVINRKVQ